MPPAVTRTLSPAPPRAPVRSEPAGPVPEARGPGGAGSRGRGVPEARGAGPGRGVRGSHPSRPLPRPRDHQSPRASLLGGRTRPRPSSARVTGTGENFPKLRRGQPESRAGRSSRRRAPGRARDGSGWKRQQQRRAFVTILAAAGPRQPPVSAAPGIGGSRGASFHPWPDLQRSNKELAGSGVSGKPTSSQLRAQGEEGAASGPSPALRVPAPGHRAQRPSSPARAVASCTFRQQDPPASRPGRPLQSVFSRSAGATPSPRAAGAGGPGPQSWG